MKRKNIVPFFVHNSPFGGLKNYSPTIDPPNCVGNEFAKTSSLPIDMSSRSDTDPM